MKSLDWMDIAACAGMDTNMFFPSSVGLAGKREAEAAYRVCAQCPVVRECAEMRDTIGGVGVWGGQLKGNEKYRTFKPPVHGTEAGYKRHRRLGQQSCGPCRDASATASAIRKERARGINA